MKKKLLFILCGIITLGSFSQSIPNGGFESWQVTSFENPVGFETSNYKKDNNVVSPLNVVKTTDAYHGNYAIKLTTAQSGTNIAFAFYANGSPGGNQGSGGIPYNQKPSGVRFRYKTNIIGTDSAVFLCWFKKSGAYIGQYTYKFPVTKTAYTLFDATFATPLPVNPDTIIVASASSNAFLQVPPNVGNSFQIDSITFKGVNSQPANFNGDFENWQMESYYQLNGWNTQGLRVNDQYSGTYALELQTQGPSFSDNNIRVGRAITGTPTQSNTLGGYPYNLTTDSLFFHYKYLPAHPLDSFKVSLSFKKLGNPIGGYAKLFPISASYVKGSMSFTLGQAPDTVIMFIESSKTETVSAFIGSDLKIDNLYFKSQMIPISNFITPSVGCVGQPVQLQDNSFNMANAWGWIMPGGIPGSSNQQNPIVIYNSVGIKTITMISSNQFGSGATISKTIAINIIPSVVSSSTVKACGATGSVVLTASGANTYSWSNGALTASILVNPSSSASYTVTGTTNGCSSDAVGQVIVPTPPQPNICMVTVDSLAQNNEIYWDKSVYPMLDSMIIYREVITNTYKRIGAVSIDSLSYFRDTTRSVGPANGNPNISTYRYKIQVRDTCGNYGPKSLWHNTVFFTHTGSTFFWSNNYQIEGPTNPIVTYSLLVCQNPSVNPAYQLVGTTTGNQNQLNDIFYSIYSATADWRVIGDFGFTCYANRSAAQGKSTPVTRSNISNNRAAAPDVSLKENAILSTVRVYPNPAQKYLTVDLFSGNTEVEMKLINILGQTVYTDTTTGNKTIDVSHLSKGVYSLSVRSGDTKKVFKVILN